MNLRKLFARGLFGLASAAAAMATGPDVIVGDLPNISNYGQTGTVAVWAVGTTSCNLGDQPLTWISGNNQHPVISQNVYRLVNGRFEQIGQALQALRAIEREGRASTGRKIAAQLAPDVFAWLEAAPVPWRAALTNIIGPRFTVEAKPGAPRARVDVRAL